MVMKAGAMEGIQASQPTCALLLPFWRKRFDKIFQVSFLVFVVHFSCWLAISDRSLAFCPYFHL